MADEKEHFPDTIFSYTIIFRASCGGTYRSVLQGTEAGVKQQIASRETIGTVVQSSIRRVVTPHEIA
jgi:hypothetical protein